jgi:hypothetical protein
MEERIMAENFEKIIKNWKKEEELEKVMQEELHIGLSDCQKALSVALSERASELVEDMPNMAPNGDYEKLTEDPEVMLKFLQEEAYKPENWIIDYVEVKKKDDQLLLITFNNKVVDDGEILKGFVFIGLSGVIRHAFAQIHS